MKHFLWLALPGLVFAAETKWNGSIQLQGQKAIWEDPSKDNLDDLWGRINLGVKTTDKEKGYTAVLNLRAFPEGFGYEALTRVKMKGDSAIEETKVNIGRFQVEQAWVNFELPLGFFGKMGRWSTTSVSSTLGNYVDADPGANWQAKIIYHNATTLGWANDWVEAQTLFGVADPKLNKGYFAGSLKLKETMFGELTAAYRSNVFDMYQDGDANIEHRMTLAWQGLNRWLVKPHAEFAMLRKDADATGYDMPVLIGASYQLGKSHRVLTEVEYLNDRQVNKEDQPLSLHLATDHKINDFARLQLGALTDAKAPDWSDLRLAARVSYNLF
jgi:hypothetical protein